MVATPTPSFPSRFRHSEQVVLYEGDCLALLRQIPDEAIQLVVTSPPYNLGKEYERRQSVEAYVADQRRVISECVRVLKPEGSICWQIGNYVSKTSKSSILPLDIVLFPVFAETGLKLRNRIIWHFEHGLHCANRFSGRYETVLWLTKSDKYTFDLDSVRVPQKYPGKKYFKGPKAGQYSCNPLGKNPGDVWIIPNVKSNHVEKTEHPCQFPIELIERLVLSTTRHGDWVLDPYVGVGTSIIAAIRHGRRGAGAEKEPAYVALARSRIAQGMAGTLKVRPRNKPVFDPKNAGPNLTVAPWLDPNQRRAEYRPTASKQLVLLEGKKSYSKRAS